jgi:hypothetical protein
MTDKGRKIRLCGLQRYHLLELAALCALDRGYQIEIIGTAVLVNRICCAAWRKPDRSPKVGAL